MESTSLVQQIRILCVDDEVNILSSLKRMLSLAGYEVLTANSGDEGLQSFESIRALLPERFQFVRDIGTLGFT